MVFIKINLLLNSVFHELFGVIHISLAATYIQWQYQKKIVLVENHPETHLSFGIIVHKCKWGAKQTYTHLFHEKKNDFKFIILGY